MGRRSGRGSASAQASRQSRPDARPPVAQEAAPGKDEGAAAAPRARGFLFALFAASGFAGLILPQSILLGMTFPLMTAGVLRAFGDRPGRSLAMLYFTNSLGAAAGVLVSGFVLVSAVGLPGTVRIAGLINIAVAAAVLPLARRMAQPPFAAVPEVRRDPVLLWF